LELAEHLSEKSEHESDGMLLRGFAIETGSLKEGAMYSIGVDFHKRYSHMTVVNGEGHVLKAGNVPNTSEAVRAFVAPYREGGQAVIEATRNWTVMYDLLEPELAVVHLAHPLKVRAIAEARIKTDRIDSKILAHLLRCDLLPTAHVRPKAERLTQQVLRQRMFLVRVRTMVKNRIHVLIDRQPEFREIAMQFSDLFGHTGLAWLRSVELPSMERQLLDSELALSDALRERIGASEAFVRSFAGQDRRIRWVRTIPGIGRFFAVLMVHEIGEIRRFRTPAKLCADAGLVPSVHASGGKVFHGRLTKQGNKWLRWAAIEAVRPAVTTDPELHGYYDRIRQRKGPNPAKAATARRLLTLVHHVLSQERLYRKPVGPRPTAHWRASRTALMNPPNGDGGRCRRVFRKKDRESEDPIDSLRAGEAPPIEG
jgi:transposase